MGILEDYLAVLDKYTSIYGQNTIVFYQNGMFFEIYGVDNEVEKLGMAREIAEMLCITLARKKTAILENNRSNYLLAGFPISQLEKYAMKLTESYNYVVVIVEQTQNAPNIVREVTNVISPGSNIKYLTTPDSNYLVSVYIENSKSIKMNAGNKDGILNIGMSSIDVSTGQTHVYQTWNTIDDNNRALDETARFIQVYDPREIIIYINDNDNDNLYTLPDGDPLNLSNRLVHFYHDNNNNKNEFFIRNPNFLQPKYQNHFLSKIYPQCGIFQPIEFIGLERSGLIVVAFIIMLDYCYNQSENILQKIQIPVIWNDHTRLVLDNNSCSQLNIFQYGNQSTNGTSNNTNIMNKNKTSGGGISNKFSSIFNLINQTSTPMGKRYLHERLSLPYVNESDMTKSYNKIEEMRQISVPEPITDIKDNIKGIKIKKSEIDMKMLDGHKNVYVYQSYEKYLNQINDIERCHRKMCLRLLNPHELNNLLLSYQSICSILKMNQNGSKIMNNELKSVQDDMLKNISEYIDYLQQYLDFSQTGKFNLNSLDENIFKYGIYSHIDQCEDEIGQCEDFCTELVENMSSIVAQNSKGKSIDLCTYAFKDDTGYIIDITTARYNNFLKTCKENNILHISSLKEKEKVLISELQCSKYNNGKNCRLSCPQLNNYSDKVRNAKKQLTAGVIEQYSKFQAQTYEKYEKLFIEMANYVAIIDFYKSGAKTSLMWNYCRPDIILNENKNENEVSSLIAEDLRHPLIERFQTTNSYVPQTIDMNKHRGILLFGVNASGKSSLMKAIGIAVILAQSGLYVPAKVFRFVPYLNVMTRIIGNDNLFKGLSSFAVEMSELRGIIQRANDHSLILGDEICHGTETISAISIVSASIITLSKQNSSFLFATHLHNLSSMECITELENIAMFHLAVKYDSKTDLLIYDRHLSHGSGSSLYGLEVAKSMNFPIEFINLANTIRKDITDFKPLVINKKSVYNTELYVEMCAVKGCKNQAVDTHHIKFKSTANSEGFIDHLQKNHMSNLVPLCKNCHQQVHCQKIGSYRLQINGYSSTPAGNILSYEYVLIKNEDKDKENDCEFNLLKVGSY